MILNEAATKLTEQGTSGLATLTEKLAGIAAQIPGLGTVFAALTSIFAAALQLQSAAIAFVDDGSGVHFNWTWPQLAALTIPGISTVAIATMLIPVSNTPSAQPE